jgi:hypothetical protein
MQCLKQQKRKPEIIQLPRIQIYYVYIHYSTLTGEIGAFEGYQCRKLRYLLENFTFYDEGVSSVIPSSSSSPKTVMIDKRKS